MKKIKYIVLIFLGIAILNSCEEVSNDVTKISDGKNIAGFENGSKIVTQIADGTEYPISVQIKVTGPSYSKVTEDITVSLASGDLSTAIAGTHFRLDEESIVLKAANNHMGVIQLTMLTAGIETPLASSPVLALTTTAASGNSTVQSSGKPILITLNYACPSELQGTYTCTMNRDGGPDVVYDDVISKTGVGTYRTTEVGHWIGGLGVGTPGYTFSDVCSVVEVPKQDLVEFYGNQVEGVTSGTVDENGVIHIVYTISSSGWTSEYDCTYVPQ